MPLSTKAFLIGFIGLFINAIITLRKQLNKAKENNIIFPWKLFWLDLGLQSAGSLLLIFAGLLALDDIVKALANIKYLPLKLLAVFICVGYMGASVADSLFGFARKRLNSAIGYKTNISDVETGNTESPTPAAPPQKSN